MSQIDRPVFIIGAGRSGTTILYHLLCFHKELCWISNVTDRNPTVPLLPFANRVVEAPLIGPVARERIIKKIKPSLRPVEGPIIYHEYSGFDSHRRMTEADWSPELDSRFKGVIKNHLRSTGKHRFLSKQTGNNQRIRLIDKMFPDAYYVHIIRDGRAVANSLHNVPWNKRTYFWWLDGRRDKWEAMGRDAIELFAIHWEKDVRELLENKHLFEDRYLEIRYEDLVAQTDEVLRDILSFCELKDYPGFLEMAPSLGDMNSKWAQTLTAEQQQLINENIGSFLTELGYELADTL